MRWGVPYQGSKNGIAEWIMRQLPAGGTFVDLFAGGCAMTHCALLSKKYNSFICNDIGDAPRLFLDGIKGKYHNERRWISRDDFARLKDSDLYVRYCWSFGNAGNAYLYSREIEPWKRALHFARVFGDCSKLAEFGIKSDGSSADIKCNHDKYKRLYIKWWLSSQEYMAEELEQLITLTKSDIERQSEELRLYLCEALRASGLTQSEVNRRLGTQMAGHYFGRSQWAFPTREFYAKMQTFLPLSKNYDEVIGLQQLWQSLQRLQSLQSLQSLESLQSLQSLQSLERLQSCNKDYREVPIPADAVVYADPPYRGTATYNGEEFDSNAFDEWVRTRDFPVYISEYTMPEDFVRIGEWKKKAMFSQTNKMTTERLFLHEKWIR